MDGKTSAHAGHTNAPDAPLRHPPSSPMTPSRSDRSRQGHVDGTPRESKESLSGAHEEASSRGLPNSNLASSSLGPAASQGHASGRRKEELEALQKQVTELEATLSLLQNSTGTTDGALSLDEQVLNNAILQETLQNQQLLVARLQSMTSAAKRNDPMNGPASRAIQLEGDPGPRHAHLLEIMPQKLQDARHFIANRTKFVSLNNQFSESKLHRTIDGGTCITKFTIHRLGDASSVKQVFDLILQMERDAAEDAVVHEDVDTLEEGTALHHTIRVFDVHGVEVEDHRVLFAEFGAQDINTPARDDNAASGTSEHSVNGALITTDFVDQDDRFPYTPSQRLREDVTSIIVVQASQSADAQRHNDQHKPTTTATGTTAAGQVPRASEIVMIRWVRATLYHANLSISEGVVDKVVEDVDRANTAFLAAVRAALCPVRVNPKPQSSTSG